MIHNEIRRQEEWKRQEREQRVYMERQHRETQERIKREVEQRAREEQEYIEHQKREEKAWHAYEQEMRKAREESERREEAARAKECKNHEAMRWNLGSSAGFNTWEVEESYLYQDMIAIYRMYVIQGIIIYHTRLFGIASPWIPSVTTTVLL